VNRLRLLIAAALICASPSFAAAEPVTIGYDVTVTTFNEQAIDPITFLLEVELISARNVGDYGYYGGIDFSFIPLGTPAPYRGGDAWYGDGRGVINGDASTGDGLAWMYLTRTIDLGTTNPPFQQFLQVMTTGPIDFMYEIPGQGQLWRGTALAVPEPSTLLLLLTGAAAFALRRKRSTDPT
jgi:hypothetical protein